jgi:hypothetical protein
MLANFLGLPVKLRNEIYVYLLVRKEPIDPWNGGYGLDLNLLSTNTVILYEARSLLYGHNCFDLTWEPGRIPEFLDTIGFTNVSHLKCIRIDFLRLYDLEDEVSLEDVSLYMLEKIYLYCTNIRMLIAALESTNTIEN